MLSTIRKSHNFSNQKFPPILAELNTLRLCSVQHFSATISFNMASQKSLTSRPLDLTYFMYIASHIPITIFFDCQSLYPTSWIPQSLLDLTAWYIQEFKDPLIANVNHLPWFKSFIYCEAFIQLPFFFWSLHGLYYSK